MPEFDIDKIRVKGHARYGWRPDTPDYRDHKFALMAPVPTPDTFSLLDKMPPVYDQGQLGSCSANALGAAFEYDQIKQGIPNWVPSRLAIYYLERKIENTVKEDAGAMLRDGAKVLSKFGVCPETTWPYNIDKFTIAPPAANLKVAKKNQVLRYGAVDQTESFIEQTLFQGTPIVFGFSVYSSFESNDPHGICKTGLMIMPGTGTEYPGKKDKNLGGHAVLAVGYDKIKRLITVRNSWGPLWGDGGYFYMPYDYILNPNLADDFWAFYSVEDGK
jgi:C1A family cysteine protease